MTLEDIVNMGEVELSGVSFGQEEPASKWSDTANTMTIVLNGKPITFVEDPDDGYRSYMGEIREGGECTNMFPPVKCFVAWSADTTGEGEIVDFTVKATGKVVLRAGTDNSDDYYPWVVQEFNPPAMVE